MKKLLFLIFVLVLFVPLTNAVTIVQVEGVVTSLLEKGGYSFDDSIEIGTTFTQSYYFSDLTDSSSDSGIGDYAGDYSVTLIGNYVFTSSEVNMSVECYEYGEYSGRSDILESDGVIYIDSLPYEYNSINWLHHGSRFSLKSTSYIPTSDEFPSLFPDLAIFDLEKTWFLTSSINPEIYDPAPDGIFLEGEITSIEVIPEPCTVLLLGLGGLVVMRGRRKNVGE